MKYYKIDRTHNTPHIYLDLDKAIFEIKGPSYSENISALYTPIAEWVEKSVPKLEKDLNCELYFDVLNSVAHKKIFQILISLTRPGLTEKKITINWYFDEDDEDIMEMGEDLIDLVDVQINLIPVNI